MTQYQKIVYIDVDVFVQKDFSKLLHLPAFGAAMLGCQDYHWTTLNGGLLIIEPNTDTFLEIMELANNKAFKWEYSEQELLNEFYLRRHPERIYPVSLAYMVPSSNYEWTDGWENGDINVNYVGPCLVHFLCTSKPWYRIIGKFHIEWKNDCNSLMKKFNVEENCHA